MTDIPEPCIELLRFLRGLVPVGDEVSSMYRVSPEVLPEHVRDPRALWRCIARGWVTRGRLFIGEAQKVWLTPAGEATLAEYELTDHVESGQAGDQTTKADDLRRRDALSREGGEAVNSLGPPSKQAGPAALDPRSRTITLDGKVFPLTEEQSRILELLARAKGGFLSSDALRKDRSSSEDPGKTLNRIPKPVRAIIEGKRGTQGGRRLLRPIVVIGDKEQVT